jgi:nucleotide-binding universal stress UspA family protein
MYKRILVPVDGSPTSQQGLAEAIGVAKVHGSCIRLIHVVNEFIIDYGYAGGATCFPDLIDSLRKIGTKVLDEAEATVSKAGIDISRVMHETVGGRAAGLIVQEAKEWGADLIVMGTHGRRGIARVAMGSDAEEVVRTACIPVLLVRGAHRTTGSHVEPVARRDADDHVVSAAG